ncbi:MULTISPECIES: response regulator transcription factor [Pseudomonas]|jgi:DNA-binding CsgD family transcriptional regulator|uniref:HTH luxR-type domain-containing protein n=1 Tax=Pseudomonas silesiensis TaxID=1853130 RepID=A0A191YZR4_9PSED|nr:MULTISPECIES: helix-turn-helix transcriptional regulator [Pseudomonas]ANJ58377.1 hypothetical protein PMA3_25665 [Pseudomonas silesiensis]QCY14724.1 LuxR family transcriptional regulator [Pseudomonas sp. MPC6]
MQKAEFGTRCHDFAQKTVSFLKNTSGCTAVVFTWYENHKTKPPHVQAGADERMITEYYDRYHGADPLRAELLIQSSSCFETLSNAKTTHDQYLLEEYQPFLHKYNIHEEMDLIFWAGGTAVASAALLQQEDGHRLNPPYLREVYNYLQYTFSILPAVRLLNLNSELELRYKLTPKERAVAELMVAGEPNKAIASRLDMELPTAKTHVLHIFQKLQVESRAKAIALLSGVQ